MFLIHTAPEHAHTVARAVVAACKGEGWCVELRPKLLHTPFNELLGEDFDFETLEPNTLDEVSLRLRSPEERLELIQLMCVIEILCNPVPVATEERIEEWARALQVPESSLAFCRHVARGEVRKSLEDVYRLNWIGDLSRRTPFVLSALSSPRARAVEQLHQAFLMTRRVGIRYRAENGANTERTIEPHYLLLSYPVWYVLAWDHLRDEVRTLRFDRIERAHVPDEAFHLRTTSCLFSGGGGNRTLRAAIRTP